MPVIQLTLDVKEDGSTLPGFPLTTQVNVSESQGKSSYNRSSNASYVELSLGDLDGISILFVKTDQDTVVRFNDQSDAGLPINANGYFLLVDGGIPSGATSKAALQNDSGSVVAVQQIAAGS